MPIAPANGNISHKFGEDRRIRRHNGIDYPVGKGTSVKASLGGLVVRSTYHEPTETIHTLRTGNKVRKVKRLTGSYGNVIIIYHGQDIWSQKYTYTLYAHLKSRSVKKFDMVKQGLVIGTSGRSGTRQGYYDQKGGYELHFEVIQSRKELTWVRTGDLDDHFAKEDKRTDPEDFFRLSSRRFAMKDRKDYIIDMGNGTTIKCGDVICELIDSKGKVLKTVMRGDRPYSGSGIWGWALAAIKALSTDFDRKGEIMHDDFPLSLQKYMTEEETKARQKKVNEFYE